MQSNIAEALSLRFPPLAINYTWEPPADAAELHPLCSMLLLARAAKGETVAITKGTCGCHGALEGFGLGRSRPEDFPGGRECFLRFLSVGNEGWEQGRAVIQKLTEANAPKILITEFAEGEGFKKTPELVTLLVDPDQLSALVVLANYARPGIDNVRIPFCAGCAGIALYPFDEARQARPRAVIGLTDISARFYLRKLLGKNILSFTAPWSLMKEMDGNVSESFLNRFAWKTMMGR